ncbi:hypothetical protein SAMN04487989_1011237 [Bizionia echini]|uniref:Uncharacterized protein n=1 Tax=Bizionia echini TaxID=649333 RepID=A0A1I5A0M5_9FLAO|nr:hypothetical protein [Bizionia echini]SFN55938.1 hypothetical protein SAMN04487989_1011237 [Bizionia echini]
MQGNVFVYGPLRVKARTIPSKNLRENSAGIFQMSTDPAMVYSIHEKAESPVSLKFTKTIRYEN